KADVLKADTTLAAKHTDLTRAKGNREIAVAQLLKLLSLTQGTDIKIIDMPAEFGGAPEVADVQELLDEAQKKRPDLLAAASRSDAEWWSRNIAFMSHLPTIRASGEMAYNIDTGLNNTTVGLSASMPLFMGFSKVYDDRIAMLNYERARENELAKSDDVALGVWTAFQNYKTAQGVLKSTNAQVTSASESEKVVAGMYKVGRSTMLDWQTSQAELASAQRQNAAAKYDLFIKRAALAMAVGTLAGD
ncbi:MAG: TolC family protein, partial [Rickettsiales bacterium]|nr:TolC family protein [Rickettsiales bacterium]